MQDVLADLDDWPVDRVAALALVRGRAFGHGDLDAPFALASVTKLLTATAVLVAVEEGSLALDQPAGPPGATIADLLAHSSGLSPDLDRVIAAPRTRRIYSNQGYEVLGGLLAEATGFAAHAYIAEAVAAALDAPGLEVSGSPAHGATGTVAGLATLVAEWRHPRILSAATSAAMREPWCPDLAGVVPGFGAQSANPWGLGPEVRGTKAPHWTGAHNDPSTFGHFGRAGGFVWFDPAADVGLIVLTDREFGPWATPRWPALADAVLAAAGQLGEHP
jgi:CubicO group peptidase (beta-lactamase class C family)